MIIANTLTEILAGAEKRLNDEIEYAEKLDEWEKGYRDAALCFLKSVKAVQQSNGKKEINKMTTEEMIKVMQAYAEGKAIERRFTSADRVEGWFDEKNPAWNWAISEYRIKPKPMPELTNGMFVMVGNELGVVIKAGYETPRVVYQQGGFDWLEDTDFEKGIKEEISKIYDARAFRCCIKKNVIWEKEK